MPRKWYDEALYSGFDSIIGYKQSFIVNKTIITHKSKFQDIEIFENPRFGKILVLDGIIQTTEADEFFYHEMFTHTPMLAHGSVKKVLIIGGGDGGILREIVKYPSLEQAIMIEIDGDVVDLCDKYMPNLNNGAFNHKKAVVRIDDGINYVKTTTDKFDLIIVDSTDPVNVGEVLFTDDFYQNAKNCLNSGGIITTQSGVPFLQKDELLNIRNKLTKIFKNVVFYIVPVPSYIGGYMALSLASDNLEYHQYPLEVIKDRFNKVSLGDLNYYNPEVHVSSFMLPQYINKILKN